MLSVIPNQGYQEDEDEHSERLVKVVEIAMQMSVVWAVTSVRDGVPESLWK